MGCDRSAWHRQHRRPPLYGALGLQPGDHRRARSHAERGLPRCFPRRLVLLRRALRLRKRPDERHVPQPVQPLRHGDAQTVSNYALPAMRWACGTGFLQGANGKLDPSGLATRAQLAAMLHRYLTK